MSHLFFLMLPLLISMFTALLIVWTQGWHGYLTLDSSSGIQKIHTDSTPRIGGVAIFAGLTLAWASCPLELATRDYLGSLLLAGTPVFAFGLIEDLTKKVSVLTRLIAALVSGVLAYYLANVLIIRLDITPLDPLLQHLCLALPLTAFAITGLTNGINLIDGFNGLASGTVIISSVAIACIAQQVGDPVLAQFGALVAAASIGFMLVNFPLGKIFLGDSGAYILGFFLACLIIALPMRNPQVSAWASLLLCSYPVIETLFSIYRRTIVSKNSLGAPDNSHLHHLIHRKVSQSSLFGRLSSTHRNSITGLLCLSLPLVAHTASIYLYSSTILCALAFFVFVLVYWSAYKILKAATV